MKLLRHPIFKRPIGFLGIPLCGVAVLLIVFESQISQFIFLQQHPPLKQSYWSHLRRLPLDERIIPAPERLIKMLKLGGDKHVVSDSDPELIADIQQALNEFPEPIYQFLENHLVGVFIVSGLNTTAAVYNLPATLFRKPAGLIVINTSKMTHSANAWHTNRIYRNFIQSESDATSTEMWSIRSQIDASPESSRQSMLQFVILHEAAHIYASTFGLEPAFYKAGESVDDKPFAQFSWTSSSESKFDSVFPERARLKFYQQMPDTFSHQDIPGIFRKLKKTDFASLYGTLNSAEDFAECFAIYVHTLLLQKPYVVEILKNQELHMTYEDPFADPRMLEKRRFLEQHLETHIGLRKND